MSMPRPQAVVRRADRKRRRGALGTSLHDESGDTRCKDAATTSPPRADTATRGRRARSPCGLAADSPARSLSALVGARHGHAHRLRADDPHGYPSAASSTGCPATGLWSVAALPWLGG